MTQIAKEVSLDLSSNGLGEFLKEVLNNQLQTGFRYGAMQESTHLRILAKMEEGHTAFAVNDIKYMQHASMESMLWALRANVEESQKSIQRHCHAIIALSKAV
jgi:hypothetical protein